MRSVQGVLGGGLGCFFGLRFDFEGSVLVISKAFLYCFSLWVILLYLSEVLGGPRGARGAFGGRSGGGMVRGFTSRGALGQASRGPSPAPKGPRDLLWFSCSGVLGRPGRPFNVFLLKAQKHTKCNRSIIFGKKYRQPALYLKCCPFHR